MTSTKPRIASRRCGRCALAEFLGNVRSVVLAVLGGLVAAGCGGRMPDDSPRGVADLPPVIGAQATCLPAFPDEDGWRGGDAAASVVLPGRDDRSSLWLFGDSFVERPEAPDGRAYPFVHNSIAISRCDEQGAWHLDYAWRQAADGTPRAFFEPAPDARWVEAIRSEDGESPYYWPISAALVRGIVFVALLRVAPGPATGPFRLPFRLLGVDVARLEPSERPPEAWSIRYRTLSERADVFPAASLAVYGDHLYAFAFLERGDGRSPRILLRLALAALDDASVNLEGELETLAEGGRWLDGVEPERARILMDDDASEMSVHFDPGSGEWLAVYSDPTGSDGASPGDTIWLRRAPDLPGPWSAPTALLRVPELSGGPDPEPGEPFCYAGKAHPELAPSGALLVTWVCNLHAGPGDDVGAVLERLRRTPSLYRPRVRRVDVPEIDRQVRD